MDLSIQLPTTPTSVASTSMTPTTAGSRTPTTPQKHAPLASFTVAVVVPFFADCRNRALEEASTKSSGKLKAILYSAGLIATGLVLGFIETVVRIALSIIFSPLMLCSLHSNNPNHLSHILSLIPGIIAASAELTCKGALTGISMAFTSFNDRINTDFLSNLDESIILKALKQKESEYIEDYVPSGMCLDDPFSLPEGVIPNLAPSTDPIFSNRTRNDSIDVIADFY